MLGDLLRRGRSAADTEERWGSFGSFGFQGIQYPVAWSANRPETPDATFLSFVDGVHRRNGVVAAAVHTRALLLSQLRFIYRRTRVAAQHGDLWGDRTLSPLERPGTMTRPELLYRLELDASYSGSAYVARVGNRLHRLMPDHVTFVLGSDSDPSWDGDAVRVPYDAEVVAILYHESRGVGGARRPTVFLPEEVAVWSPEPDPVNFWRGQSWVTSVIREIATDGQATEHVQKFFEQATTPNMVFTLDAGKTPDEVRQFAEVINERHSGATNAWRNLFLGGGADVKVVGSSLESLNLKDLTGGLENRVAIRSRVPAVILGAREGLSGSSLNAGNYVSARRLLADGWFAPTAQSLCAALEAVVPAPSGSELWFDSSEVLFLQEDEKDAAEIIRTQANSVRTLIDGGFDPGTVVDAVSTGDLTRLVHSGNVSVQLRPVDEAGTPSVKTQSQLEAES